LRVLCLEMASTDTDPVGESLDWSAPDLLKELGLPMEELIRRGIATYKRHVILKLQDGTEQHYVPGAWLGRAPFHVELRTLHVDRNEVNASIRAIAVRDGVQIRIDRVVSVEKNERRRVLAVHTESGARISSPWFLDASGSATTLFPRVFKLPMYEYGPSKVAIWDYFKVRNSPEGTTLYGAAMDSYMEWVWQIPIREDTVSVGYVASGDTIKRARSRGMAIPDIYRAQLNHFPALRPKFVSVARMLRSPAVSPNGARAVFAARGEIITVPAEKGDPRNLTNTPGVMEREPQWSPDGKSIAYLSDESGEYALHVRDQSGEKEPTKIELEPGVYSSPRFSPDSKKIALTDSFQRLWYVDLETKKQMEVDQDTYQMRSGDIAGAWSPDSKWLAYSKVLANELSAIHLFSLTNGKATQVTDGMSDAENPVFDRDGKYLYFTASTNSGESLGLDIHAVGRTSTSSIYLAVLDKKQTSPFAPESDEEKASDEKKPDAPKPEAAKPDAAKPRPGAPDVEIDLDAIDQRILSVPMPPRRYVALQAGKAGTLLALESQQPGEGAPDGPPGPPGMTIHRYDLKARKSDVALAGVRNFQMSFGGEKALYRQGDNWIIAPLRPMATGPAATPPPAGGPAPTPLKTAAIEVRVDPVQEWRQMYREAWRTERDWFYDRNAHGLDLKAAEKKYEPYLRNVASRNDLTYLFQEMLGNLVVSHMGTGGGDLPEVKRVQTGLLGADYEVANGRYRFARVYSGENWNPQLRAPLTQPGVNVKTGEYLLSVDGREVRPPDNVYSFFEQLAGKSVILRVGLDASGAGAREVTVIPVPDESRLRNLAWIEENRRKVDQMTAGKVAYIYMPDTANGGLAAFNRYFYAQIGKDGAIVDERFNGGGLLATDIAEILNRKPLSAASNRVGTPLVQPQGIFGPKAMIINERAGSGGDAMPWYFKRAGVGKLIGTRTWGGLVGMAGGPGLMDGGFLGAPSSGIYNPISGEWEVENIGVPPDVEVEQDPALVRKGRDPQLEKAVEVVLEELKKNPPPTLRRPAFPNYHRSGAQ